MNRLKDTRPDGLTGLEAIVDALTGAPFYQNRSGHKTGMPSLQVLSEIIQRLQVVFYPGFHAPLHTSETSLRRHLAANLASICHLLAGQVASGLRLGPNADEYGENIAQKADELADNFIGKLPHIRALLESDVRAAYEGDPAAKSPAETILCYPSIKVMTHHRIAHELCKLGVPLIPRMISEMAHSATGTDIHPGAQIGDNFFIDHCTGVVIGETSIIGKGCRIYQGVSLGALSFPREEDGSLSKGRLRHPILEDNVVVYAGATILGRITIGRDSVIGGNVWLTHDVPPSSKIIQQRSTTPRSNERLLDNSAK